MTNILTIYGMAGYVFTCQSLPISKSPPGVIPFTNRNGKSMTEDAPPGTSTQLNLGQAHFLAITRGVSRSLQKRKGHSACQQITILILLRE